MIHAILGSIVLLVVLLFIVAYLTWMEAKFAAKIQSRIGPYWVGKPHGWLQPVADGLKLFIKEDLVPKKADRPVFNLAPVVALITGLWVYASIPIAPSFGLTDLNIGILYFLAVSSLIVIGIFMAGWGSNNKYAILSGMRLASQLVSYEVPLVLSALVPVLLAGSMKVSDIINAQSGLWFIAWPVVGQVSFIIFILATLAEGDRIPFDIPEAESELVAGFNVEYSGMKFAYFYIAEYAHLFAVSAIGAVLFLGGWKGPFHLPALWFLLKTYLLFFFILWIRWSYLRIRVDQLMRFNWKILVPISLLNLFLAGLYVLFLSL